MAMTDDYTEPTKDMATICSSKRHRFAVMVLAVGVLANCESPAELVQQSTVDYLGIGHLQRFG